MARDPGSAWKPLPEAGAPDGHRKTQFIVHSTGTMASAAANWNYFLRGDVVVESTFIVGWGPDDPTLQIMDSTDHADANGRANQRGISIETVGDGAGPFNDWQVRELVRLGLWARQEHGILPRIIPSEPEGGFGWHVMFGAPGPWTSVRGKICPGGRRIQQLKDTILPAIFAGTPVEDDMPFRDWPHEDKMALADFVVNGVLRTKFPKRGPGQTGETSIEQEIAWLPSNLAAVIGAASSGGDPEALAKALREVLGDDLAADVASRLRITPA